MRPFFLVVLPTPPTPPPFITGGYVGTLAATYLGIRRRRLLSTFFMSLTGRAFFSYNFFMRLRRFVCQRCGSEFSGAAPSIHVRVCRTGIFPKPSIFLTIRLVRVGSCYSIALEGLYRFRITNAEKHGLLRGRPNIFAEGNRSAAPPAPPPSKMEVLQVYQACVVSIKLHK